MIPATRHSRLVLPLVGMLLLSMGGDAGSADLAAVARRAFEESYYTEAEAAARKHLAQVEAATGPGSPQTAEALDLLVRCLPFGPNAKAEESLELAQRAVDLKRRHYGDQDSRLALSLTYKAFLLWFRGSNEEARQLLDQALRMSEETLGRTHRQVALVLHHDAVLLESAGEYDACIASCERALRILEATTPLDSVLASAVLSTHSLARFLIDDYAGAFESIDWAIAIRLALYKNHDHPRVQGLVNNRANMLFRSGDRVAAKEAYVEVLESLRHTLEDSLDTRIGVATLNLAVTTMSSDPAASRALFATARQIFENRLGSDHQLVSTCVLDLGISYYLTGELRTARSYFEQALRLCESAGSEHPLVAHPLQWLAAADYELGDVAATQRSCERALAIYETTVGPDNPDVAAVLVLLAAALADSGKVDTAIAQCLRAERIGAEHLRLMSRGFAERQALLYAQERPRGLDLPLAHVAKGTDPETVRRVWDVAIRSRTLVYDEMAARQRSATLARDPEVAHLYAELRRASTRLTRLIVAGPETDAEGTRSAIAAARQERESAEKALALRCAPLREEMARERAGLAEVAASLPAGWALVSYVVYTRASGRLAPGVPRYGLRQESEPPFVQAFVLGANGTVGTAAIGPLADVEALVAACAASGKNPRAKESLSAYRRTGAALRAKVWDPVEPLLGNASRVLIVPDGILHKVSFATFPLDSGDYLVDSGRRFHYLGSERDLVGMEPSAENALFPQGDGILALGDIDFSTLPERSRTRPTRDSAPVNAGASTRGGPCGLVGVKFPRLPGTAVEIKTLAALCARIPRHSLAKNEPASRAVTLLRGSAATEAAFKQGCSGHQILHIATHGFAVGPDCEGAPDSSRSIVPIEPQAGGRSTNVLTLSGLALAGANHRHEIPDEHEDGILTAEEVASLDLQGLEWAVLSGCDTGIGVIQSGEGVLGLRRAFRVAGARTLIMSLFPVSDRATVEWMEALYTARLVRGSSTIDAVHSAMHAVLDARRQRGESTHPFYWGGFVATGDWR